MMIASVLVFGVLGSVFGDGGHSDGIRQGHAHPRVAGTGRPHVVGSAANTIPTQDFVAPEYFKCLNQVNGAFYFYDTSMLKEYALGKVSASPLRPTTEPCDFLTPLTNSYKVYDVTLQPDIGKMKLAIGTNPNTKKQQIVACNAISWDFAKTSDGILCTAELAKDVNNARTQAYIGNINDPRFKSA